MADEPEVEEVKEVRFLPPPNVWKYLGWLARNTLLGKTEQEVARQVLINKLTEMRQEDYRDPSRRDGSRGYLKLNSSCSGSDRRLAALRSALPGVGDVRIPIRQPLADHALERAPSPLTVVNA
jgi:hypothetical protein